MRILKILAIALLAAFMLAACSSQRIEAPPAILSATIPNSEAQTTSGAPAALEGYAADANTAPSEKDAPSQIATQRMVVKTASIAIQVAKVPDAEASIRARAEQLGGYVVSVQTNGSGDDQTSTITFRVPSDKFSAALADVEGLASKVLSRSLGGEDVTEEFVDLESRLRNLEATRDRLLDMLTKADKVEDAIQVNNALTDVQGQIEQIQGRMKYLKDSAALATITAEIQPVPPPPAIVSEDSWQPMIVARRALAGLVEFGQGLAELAIVLLIWTPVWLSLLLAARWGWRRASRRWHKASTTPAAPPQG